jgi:hypothetical protein
MTNVTISFHSFDAFDKPSKERVFVMDAMTKWAPKGFFTWIADRSQLPAMVRLRENKMHAHEAAAKLIKEKKQDLKDCGRSRRDLLSLMGSFALHL